jgi:hypothetical protein
MAVLKETVTHLRLPSASSPISQVSPDATAGSQLTSLKDIEVVTVPQSTGKDMKPRPFIIVYVDEKEEWRSESVRKPVHWEVDCRL